MMIQRKIFITLLIIFTSLIQISCDKSNESDLLNQRVNELVTVIEEHKEQDIKRYFADKFSVAKGFNQNNFFLFVRYQLKRNRNISISLTNKEIKLHGLSADVTADVLLLGADGWLPERGQQYYVASRWKKENGNWVMSHLRWENK